VKTGTDDADFETAFAGFITETEDGCCCCVRLGGFEAGVFAEKAMAEGVDGVEGTGVNTACTVVVVAGVEGVALELTWCFVAGARTTCLTRVPKDNTRDVSPMD